MRANIIGDVVRQRHVGMMLLSTRADVELVVDDLTFTGDRHCRRQHAAKGAAILNVYQTGKVNGIELRSNPA